MGYEGTVSRMVDRRWMWAAYLFATTTVLLLVFLVFDVDPDRPYSADKGGNLAEWVQALILLVTAVAIFVQVRDGQRLRRQELRPYVVIRPAVRGRTLVMLEITNTGRTVARDVRIELSPDSPRTTNLVDDFAERIERPRPSLAPGELWRFSYLNAVDGSPADWPTCSGTVTYTDETGEGFSEEFIVDVAAYSGALLPFPEVEETLHKIEEHLRKQQNRERMSARSSPPPEDQVRGRRPSAQSHRVGSGCAADTWDRW